MITPEQQARSDMLMDRLETIDYHEEKRLKRGIFSDEFKPIFDDYNDKPICINCDIKINALAEDKLK
jgi:hypothetical protein